MAEPIRVIVVGCQHSAAALATALLADGAIDVLATVESGTAALEDVQRLAPDLVVVELQPSPPDDCLFLARLAVLAPGRVLAVVSSLPHDRHLATQAIAAGALDVVAAPDAADNGKQRSALLAKVRLLTYQHSPPNQQLSWPAQEISRGALAEQVIRLVAIVASTGGPSALAQILHALPGEFPAALLIVQHIAHGFVDGLADWYARECALPVQVARDGDAVKTGQAWLAPDDHHLLVEEGGYLRLTRDAPVMSLRPCGDVLLQSVAQVYGRHALGVVLTGMGSDGARGLRALKLAGGRTIVQDKASSAIFGMPRAAIEAGAADEVLPIEAIGERLVALVCQRN